MSVFFSAQKRTGVYGKLSKIAAGGLTTFALTSDGRPLLFGDNYYGKLGINVSGSLTDTSIRRTSPVRLLGISKTFCKISVGFMHCVGIDKNDAAWAWGYNSTGMLGDGTTITRYTPVKVLGYPKNFYEINAGLYHTLAIDYSGQIWGWGGNGNGQSGINDPGIASILTPMSILGTRKTFCKISGGEFMSSAIDKNGKLWTWGANNNGQLGNNDAPNSQCTPVSVLGTAKTFCEISAGKKAFVAAIDKNGKLYTWGLNFTGSLGDNNVAISRQTPVSVGGSTKTFCQVSAGFSHMAAIDKNGTVWGWGHNTYGEVGNKTYIPQYTPVSVLGQKKTFCQIFAGHKFTVAVDYKGIPWAWGYNIFGQLGNKRKAFFYTSPVQVGGQQKTFCKIATGGYGQTGTFMSFGLDKNGKGWAWGYGLDGGLAYGDRLARPLTPVAIGGNAKTFCEITGGARDGYAIDVSGKIWSWGVNWDGSLGFGNLAQNIAYLTPAQINARTTFKKISGGADYGLAIDSNGAGWAWGTAINGQLGVGDNLSKNIPTQILGLKTFCEICAGYIHSVGLDKNGKVWTWGNNQYGCLGVGSGSYQVNTPVLIANNVSTFCKIFAGHNTTFAIDKNGQIWSWGLNNFGQLGNNTTVSQCIPVAVAGQQKTFCRIAAFGTGYGAIDNVFAIDKNGQIWGWGKNSYGQMLAGVTSTTHSTPVAVNTGNKTFCDIRINGDAVDLNEFYSTTLDLFGGYLVALDKNGKVWTWGYGPAGGTGAIVPDTSTPVRICNI